jgi:hypothetical protein
MRLKTTRVKSVERENAYKFMSEKSENVFHETPELDRAEGGRVRVRLLLVLPRADQGVHECDGE